MEKVLVQDTNNEILSDFIQKNQTPVQVLCSLRIVDLRVIALHRSFVNLRMPQNASLFPLISEPIRLNVFFFVICTRGGFALYPEQVREAAKQLLRKFVSLKEKREKAN